jgi:hypothetical protein
MTVCSYTGISVPECSCRVCLQAQIERNMPSLPNPGEHRLAPMIDTAEHELSMEGDGAMTARFPRLRLATRLRRRRLRRAA